MSNNRKLIKTINFLKQVKKLVKTERMKFQQCFLKAIHSNQLVFKSKSNFNCTITKMNLTREIVIEKKRKL